MSRTVPTYPLRYAPAALPLTAAALALTAAGGFGWASFERRWMRLSRVQVPTRPGTPALKILHISDLHLTTRTHWIVDFVRSLADLEPDFVVSTGDNFNSRDALAELTRAYSPLLDFPGAFVLGAHDFYSPYSSSWSKYLLADSRKVGNRKRHRKPDLPTPDFVELLTSHGWIQADNRAEGVTVSTPSGRAEISVCGTGDAHMEADSLSHIGSWPAAPGKQAVRESQAAPEAQGVRGTQGVRESQAVREAQKNGDKKLRLGITHAPYQRVLDSFARAGSDLILAGHTHGGQLCLPFYGALVTNCDLPRQYASGLNYWPAEASLVAGGSWLNVSAGLGTTYHAPFRFACRPTATLLELVPQQ